MRKGPGTWSARTSGIGKISQSAARLRWQSHLTLLLALSLGTAGIGLQGAAHLSSDPAVILQALVLGAILGLLTWRFRAATPAAASTGGLFAAALYLATPGWHTALWPLLTLMLLTFAATRFGRARKEKLGVAEARHGRTAAQVAANLGVAVMATIPLGLARLMHLPAFFAGNAMHLAFVAALAEAAADTLSSELGEVLGGEPRLLTTLRPVPAGTDGAISAAGTFAGMSAAVAVAATAYFALGLTPSQAALVTLAAIAGLFIDSCLGAVFERRGWLNNDAVNFLSTLAAAVLASALVGR
ncbi:MAG: DUF92 domain-containing protein [Silvibacterium sp.]